MPIWAGFTLLFVALAFPTSSHAQEIPKTITASINWSVSRDSRRAAAADWLHELSRLDSQIPTLSPSERAWLAVEYDEEIARNGGLLSVRANRARYSKEGASRFAKPPVRRMSEVLELLAGVAALDDHTEVALWAELMFLGLDMNLWGDVARLGELGVLRRDPNTNAGTDGLPRYQDMLHGIWASRAQLVLGSVLMPFIERTHYQ